MSTMIPGQYLTLTAQPLVNGAPGGILPGPIVWSHNANLIGIAPTLTPSGDTLTCTLFIPNTTTNFGSFSVFANCGTLSATIVVMVQSPIPPANGLQITAGTPS